MNSDSKYGRFIAYIFPLSLLEGTPWLQAWKVKENEDFVGIAKVIFPISAILYVSHYFLFDKPMGLTPLQDWLIFRLSMAAIALATFVLYFTQLARTTFYRAPAIITFLIFCYSQAQVTIRYPEAPWLYCFLFVGIASLTLRASVVTSAVFAVCAIFIQWSTLLETGVPSPTLFSAAFVTLLLIVASRGGYVADLRYFLLNQQNTDSQRRNIELNIEFTDRIKSFIPGEIAKRLDFRLRERDTTVLQAIDEVLRPRKKQIACLFSDIRGYTEASKNLENFIGELVLPNVKACTSAIDDNGGIPRKIGDLIFAYFDGNGPHLNLLQAIRAAFQITEVNESQNGDTADGQKITRYILVSVGDAYVGNIGGFDSSVEITALGSPVNLLSRIDELTKEERIAAELDSGDLVLSSTAYNMMFEIGLRPFVKKLILKELGLSIRNFPDEECIYVMAPNEANKNHFSKFYRFAVESQEHLVDERPNKVA